LSLHPGRLASGPESLDEAGQFSTLRLGLFRFCTISAAHATTDNERMNTRFAPHKLGVHRQTCLSLYRALLRECSRVGVAIKCPNLAETLRGLVRFRFHQDRIILSHSRVGNGLIAASDYLALLRDCSAKTPAAIEQLTATLEMVSSEAEIAGRRRELLASRWKPPPPERIPHLRNLRANASKRNQTSTPSNPRIFQHPRPISEVKSGVRKVPNLIVAHGIPLLKYPGPVPVLVSRVINQKYRWSRRQWDRHGELQNTMQLANWEDEWDQTLARNSSIPLDYLDEGDGKGSKKKRWTEQVQKALKQISNAVGTRGRQYAKLGDRYFHEVIVKERELKEAERKEAKRLRRIARKQARDEATSTDGRSDDEINGISSGFL
jgi:hypothetical protein